MSLNSGSEAADRVSMLLEFRARNVRSFRDELTLSLEATRLSRKDVVREVPWRQDGHPLEVLPVAGIFGPNASGKSNLLKAIDDMRRFILTSFRRGGTKSRIQSHPFLLGEDRGEAPSTYEVDLVLGGVRHEYGFTVGQNRVIEEWARSFPKGRSLLLFHRELDEVRLGSEHRSDGRATLRILRSNALFLSAAAAAEHQGLTPLSEWFGRNLIFADVTSRTARQALTLEMIEGERGDQVLELLREADLGITGIEKRDLDPEIAERVGRILDFLKGELEEEEGKELDNIELNDFEIRLRHQSCDDELALATIDESRGTLVWLGVIGLVVETLREGSVLLADELEASLHPTLVAVLVSLFQSHRSNPNRAQLIFNSHDVTLLGDSSSQPLGRDQVWFTEKDRDGSTRLFPLTDLDPRKSEALGRRYLSGRYGATPIISIGQLEDIAAPTGDID